AVGRVVAGGANLLWVVVGGGLEMSMLAGAPAVMAPPPPPPVPPGKVATPPPPPTPVAPARIFQYQAAFYGVLALFMAVFGGLILFGAIRMKQMRNYGIAI